MIFLSGLIGICNQPVFSPSAAQFWNKALTSPNRRWRSQSSFCALMTTISAWGLALEVRGVHSWELSSFFRSVRLSMGRNQSALLFPHQVCLSRAWWTKHGAHSVSSPPPCPGSAERSACPLCLKAGRTRGSNPLPSEFFLPFRSIKFSWPRNALWLDWALFRPLLLTQRTQGGWGQQRAAGGELGRWGSCSPKRPPKNVPKWHTGTNVFSPGSWKMGPWVQI